MVATRSSRKKAECPAPAYACESETQNGLTTHADTNTSSKSPTHKPATKGDSSSASPCEVKTTPDSATKPDCVPNVHRMGAAPAPDGEGLAPALAPAAAEASRECTEEPANKQSNRTRRAQCFWVDEEGGTPCSAGKTNDNETRLAWKQNLVIVSFPRIEIIEKQGKDGRMEKKKKPVGRGRFR